MSDTELSVSPISNRSKCTNRNMQMEWVLKKIHTSVIVA